MLLSLSNGFQVFFVFTLVLDQGGNGKCRDGQSESPVRAGDWCENVQTLGLAGGSPRAILVLDFFQKFASSIDGSPDLGFRGWGWWCGTISIFRPEKAQSGKSEKKDPRQYSLWQGCVWRVVQDFGFPESTLVPMRIPLRISIRVPDLFPTSTFFFLVLPFFDGR